MNYFVTFIKRGKEQTSFSVPSVTVKGPNFGMPDILETFQHMPEPLQGSIMRGRWVSIGPNTWELALRSKCGHKVYGVILASALDT